MTKMDGSEVPGPPRPEVLSSKEGSSVPAKPAIPAAEALEIRRLVHDLSNALEIIIQSSYLLSTSDLPEESRQWIKLLEQGVQQSARINQELRAYIVAHS
jgi:hypothetical protein